MSEFKVVLEIQMEANNPLEAAKTLEKWIKEDGGFQYYVQNMETQEIHTVDLSEDDDDDAVLPADDYQPLIKN